MNQKQIESWKSAIHELHQANKKTSKRNHYIHSSLDFNDFLYLTNFSKYSKYSPSNVKSNTLSEAIKLPNKTNIQTVKTIVNLSDLEEFAT